MLRAKLCVTVLPRISSSPSSAPQNTTSIPSSRTPASSSKGASGVPVHSALCTAPMKGPKPRLPAHSREKTTLSLGRERSCDRVNDLGRSTSPLISRRQSLSAISGWP